MQRAVVPNAALMVAWHSQGAVLGRQRSEGVPEMFLTCSWIQHPNNSSALLSNANPHRPSRWV